MPGSQPRARALLDQVTPHTQPGRRRTRYPCHQVGLRQVLRLPEVLPF
ncbi:hypothetical protein [Streptomyces sp. MNP-20]|nr:hypothetical protein [Streptomyces sp. MNP-20]